MWSGKKHIMKVELEVLYLSVIFVSNKAKSVGDSVLKQGIPRRVLAPRCLAEATNPYLGGYYSTTNAEYSLQGAWSSEYQVASFRTLVGEGVLYDLVIWCSSFSALSGATSSIRLWAISGQVLMEMVGHTSICYSVDSHVSGLIVSGSEDCFAKIWKVVITVIQVPNKNFMLRKHAAPPVRNMTVLWMNFLQMENDFVWDVKFLENGDIVTACSDGVVRIWTVNNDKIDDLSELESFASQLSHYKISRKKVGGLKLDLPGLEALQLPGTSDGQTKVVRKGDNGVAYAWNLREQKWDKVRTLSYTRAKFWEDYSRVYNLPLCLSDGSLLETNECSSCG
ncbi:hypothetical protein RHGRI_033843 [Rhododendron griersonianum]|uniref:Uncharacterized protein n=1 Tax=Rhododendron griersonianum TaxID=479676 RepID=A0AAV6HZ06_9ERIC|nr:hypothetical protein RHGRI_033843 [Rhododendron griersonianum]